MIIIFGTQNIATLAIEVFQQNDLLVYGLLQEIGEDTKKEINHIPILGHIDDPQYLALIGEKCQAFIALDQPTVRQKFIHHWLEQGYSIPINAIYPSTTISSSAQIGHGNLIHMGTMVGPKAHLGSYCILHQQIAIEQGVIIKDFVQIGAGSVIGQNSVIEKNVFIGIGATLVPGIHVGANASIGAGSVVLEHVPAGVTVLGNPAKPIKYI